MSRTSFVEKHGGLVRNCRNWSFVDENRKQILFGVWSKCTSDDKECWLILHKNWQYKEDKKQGNYTTSIQHVELMVNKGYKLCVFEMENTAKESETAQIGSIKEVLVPRKLVFLDGNWYAAPLDYAFQTDEI